MAKKGRFDRELELVQRQKAKLFLELVVPYLSQAIYITPAPPSIPSATTCAFEKESQPKRGSDGWPQGFVPAMSANVDLHSLGMLAFVAGYSAMIRTHDTETSNLWGNVPGFYSYLARQVEL